MAHIARDAHPAELAGRILTAWRNGEEDRLEQELKRARLLAQEARPAGTLEMETMEALSGAVESLGQSSGKHAGAIRLLEHIARRDVHSGAFWPKAS